MEFKNELRLRVEAAEDVVCRFLPDVEGMQKTIFEAMEYGVTAGGKRQRTAPVRERLPADHAEQ